MTKNFVFILVPNFTLLGLGAAIDALRAANKVSETKIYQWSLVAEPQWRATSSSGVAIETQPLNAVTHADTIVVCGGNRSHVWQDKKLIAWLRNRASEEPMIGAISDGSFILAEAGLFDGYRSTIHWECWHAYKERNPGLDIRASMYEVDRDRFSCAGGTAALDLMLTLIMADCGAEIAYSVAENYLHDFVRGPEATQRLSAHFEMAGKSRIAAHAMRLMQQNLEEPIAISAISDQLNISHRQLDRLFRKHLQMSPKVFYTFMRLDRATQLLRQTDLPVSEVAAASGFCESSHLSKAFRQWLAISPNAYRNLSGQDAITLRQKLPNLLSA